MPWRPPCPSEQEKSRGINMAVEELIAALRQFKPDLLVEFVPGGGGAWINVTDEDGELIATVEEDGQVGFPD